MWTWYESKVIDIVEESPTTRRFFLKTEVPVSFKAGQFVTMDLPISERRLKRWRSYSIASAPTERGDSLLEFCIVKAENSTGGSRYFFEEVTIGTPIKFKAPDGNFGVKPEILASNDVVFICTGTGVAPFRSILKDIQNQDLAHRGLHLIFGTRYESGILYRTEFEALEKNVENFRFDAVLSRQSDWQGQKGYVHSVYTEGYAAVRSDVHFYICGWSNMIDEAVENLILKLGYDKSQIHYELYG